MRISDWSSDVCSSDLSVSPPPPLSCADLIRASIYHAARSSVSPRRTGLRIQEPPDQEALHVTAAIGNQIDDNTPLLDAIDQPVGLEEDLAKLGDAEVGKLARMAHAPRKLGKVAQILFNSSEEGRVGNEGVRTCRSWWWR